MIPSYVFHKSEGGIPMDSNWMILWQQQNAVGKVMETNRAAGKYGLVLRKQDAELIVAERNQTLREQRRVEFGPGISEKIIYEFCDSAYIDQDHYVEVILRLQEIFYLYKNEMLDEITDDELLHFMKEQFENVCFGDLDYLEGTCLNIFARAIRAGYGGFKDTEGYGEYGRWDEVKRWDYELYLEALKDLC